jgi:hypothetical protein
MARRDDIWPSLPLREWKDTYETLHLWAQVAGKIRLKQTPLINHWWNAPFYVTARGLTTSAIPHGLGRSFTMEFDFISHNFIIQTSENSSSILSLVPMTVSEFYARVGDALKRLDMPVPIWTRPVEIENPIPFEEDELHGAYDPEYAWRHWRILTSAQQVFTEFRSAFQGKCSPVHFFWGGFDLAVTRFSGRRAPEHAPSPIVAASIMREAYSHEVSSCGFWPGGGPVKEPSFYSYAYPEPKGFKEYPVVPDGAYYSRELGEFILPYDRVRESENPEETLLQFLQTTYEAAAELGGWNRRELEREMRTRLAASEA